MLVAATKMPARHHSVQTFSVALVQRIESRYRAAIGGEKYALTACM